MIIISQIIYPFLLSFNFYFHVLLFLCFHGHPWGFCYLLCVTSMCVQARCFIFAFPFSPQIKRFTCCFWFLSFMGWIFPYGIHSIWNEAYGIICFLMLKLVISQSKLTLDSLNPYCIICSEFSINSSGGGSCFFSLPQILLPSLVRCTTKMDCISLKKL